MSAAHPTRFAPGAEPICFEDLEPGAVTTYGPFVVQQDDMIAFARRFDPQPFHLDEAAAASSPVGGLIASGWFTAASSMRMLCDAWALRAAIRGGLGIPELSWLRPVRAGDVLTARQTILERRDTATRPDAGIVRFRVELGDAAGTATTRLEQVVLVGRRSHAPPPPRPRPVAAGEPAAAAPEEQPDEMPLCWEDVAVGRAVDLGTVAFTDEAIIAFARRFDPQDFHLDRDAGASGPFGALAASGWHTAAGWMGRYAARLDRIEAERGARPAISVSPGFSDLRWLRPVLAGETIRYATEPTGKRPLASRPGFGLVTSRNTGVNARGETVFRFDGAVIWRMRPNG